MYWQDANRLELFEADIVDELAAPAAFPSGSMIQFELHEYVTLDDGSEIIVGTEYYADCDLCWRE